MTKLIILCFAKAETGLSNQLGEGLIHLAKEKYPERRIEARTTLLRFIHEGLGSEEIKRRLSRYNELLSHDDVLVIQFETGLEEEFRREVYSYLAPFSKWKRKLWIDENGPVQPKSGWREFDTDVASTYCATT